MRFLSVVILLSLAVAAAYAVPAKPGLRRTLTLTDGTTVGARLVGDEYGHYWLGDNGKAYQTVKGSKSFGEVSSIDVRMHAQERRTAVNQQRSRRQSERRAGTLGNYTGKKKGLIILVNFSDVAFSAPDANTLFRRIANEKDFTEGKFKGSMHDYFYAQSGGLFDLTFDVVGPYTVSNEQAYYGSNNSKGNDMHPAEMVIEALGQADAEVDYADYDWDADGEVDQVYVVYAGKGEADGGDDITIWPHKWSLSSASANGDGTGAQTLDGVTIDTYACGAELDGSTGDTAGIGTMCHEFSHCLGYPDLYDIDYSGGQGMGYWDLMASGSYNGGSYQPAGYTSYERWVAGWMEPIELTATRQVTAMKPLQDGGESYVIYNNGNRDECFLLENRQKTGWDASLPGEGLLILHLDYDKSVWDKNKPNDDPSHQRLTWIAADNDYQYVTYDENKYYTVAGMATDPFPYGEVNAFGRSTVPAAMFYNKNTDDSYYLDSSVEEITQATDGTMSFFFRGPTSVEKPVFSMPSGGYDEPFDVAISCDTEGATIHYTLDGTAPTPASTVYTHPVTISTTTKLMAVAVVDDDVSMVATARYGFSNPETRQFRLVTSTADLYSGMRYIIGCGSKATAAGGLDNKVLGSNKVTVEGDIITIGDDVDVFVLEDAGVGWTMMNEESGEYLYADSKKTLTYSSVDDKTWKLSDGTEGVVMAYSVWGTMLYNANYPRFTVYTSNTNASMIQANLYMEYSGSGVPDPDPDPDSSAAGNSYVLVSDASMLAAGDEILIAHVTGGDDYVMGTTQKENNREAVSVTLNTDGTLTPGTDAQVITLEEDGEGHFLFGVGDGYLYAASGSSNVLQTTSAPDDNAKATITIDDFGDATIMFQGENTRNLLLFNPNKSHDAPLFACYQSVSSAVDMPQVYRRVIAAGDANRDGRVTIADVTAIVNYLLTGQTEHFDRRAADVDGSGDITIDDAIAVTGMVLEK